jgi:HTH-type transcriptional regulator/antitoxin HipB
MGRVSVHLIGEAVRYHRRRGGLSQRDLADLAGVGKTSVFDIEKGKPTVRLDTLVAVLRVLNIQMGMNSPLMDEFAATLPDRGDSTP